jgi:hypothetical protein
VVRIRGLDRGIGIGDRDRTGVSWNSRANFKEKIGDTVMYILYIIMTQLSSYVEE